MTLMQRAAQGTEVVRRDVAAESHGRMKRRRPEMLDALPKAARLTPERMARIALTTFRTMPKLLECSTGSLLGALVQCAQLGLEPDPRLGLAYFVPFKRSAKRDGTWESWTECQLIVGYRGKIALARRSGEITIVEAHVVHEHDELDLVYGSDQRLVHRPNVRGDRGEPVCVYALARYRDGGVIFDCMSIAEIDRVASRPKPGAKKADGDGPRMPSEGPWVTDYLEMAKKTVVHRLSKYLPQTPEMAEAEAMDGAVISGLDLGGKTAEPMIDAPSDVPMLDRPTHDEPAPDAPPISDADRRRALIDRLVIAERNGIAVFRQALDDAQLGADCRDWHTRDLETLRRLASAVWGGDEAEQ